MNLSVILFITGILGFVLNRKNIILLLISIEMMLLAIAILVLVTSYSFDDIVGQTYSVYLITITAAESAVGLGLLVAATSTKTTVLLNAMSSDYNSKDKIFF